MWIAHYLSWLPTNPSISNLSLLCGQIAVAAGCAGYPCCPDTQECFPAPLGKSRGIPMLDDTQYVVPPVCSGSTLGSPPSWMCLEDNQREVPRRHTNEMPDPETPEPRGYFQHKGTAALSPSSPLDVQAPHLNQIRDKCRLYSKIFYPILFLSFSINQS